MLLYTALLLGLEASTWLLCPSSENTISMLLPPPRTGLYQALGPALCITHMNVLKYNFGETVACQPAYFRYPVPAHLNPDPFFFPQGGFIPCEAFWEDTGALGLPPPTRPASTVVDPYLCPTPTLESSDCGRFPAVCGNVSTHCPSPYSPSPS